MSTFSKEKNHFSRTQHQIITILMIFFLFFSPSLLKAQEWEDESGYWYHAKRLNPNFILGGTAALGIGAGIAIASLVCGNKASHHGKRGPRGLTGPVGAIGPIGPIGPVGPAFTPATSTHVKTLSFSFTLTNPNIKSYQALVTAPDQSVIEKTVTSQTDISFGSNKFPAVFIGTYILTAAVNLAGMSIISPEMEVGTITAILNNSEIANQYQILIPITNFSSSELHDQQIAFEFTIPS